MGLFDVIGIFCDLFGIVDDIVGDVLLDVLFVKLCDVDFVILLVVSG